MTKPRSNTRRFVNAAWSLLTFQLIASAGAVAVTGWAAFHVQQIAANAPIPAPPDQAFDTPYEETAATPAPETDTVAPAPEQPVQVSPCLSTHNPFRVDARAGWCDSGFVVQAGQRYFVRVGDGRWSNAGPPSYGPEGAGAWEGTIVRNAALGALIGRVGDAAFAIGAGPEFTSPATGPLYLSINDVPGTFDDNQGSVEVYIYGTDTIQ